MKIQFLGTAAAEGLPALFCECEVCRKARERGGRELRSRCQSLIDEDLLLDLPPDTNMHAIAQGLHLSKVKHIVITHIHEDHFYVKELLNLGEIQAAWGDHGPMHIYGSIDVKNEIDKLNFRRPDRLVFHELKPFETQQVGDYEITPYPAVHGTDHPFFYLISKGGKNLLYCHDTAIFEDNVWEDLKRRKLHLDIVSLDCTEGIKTELPYVGHMCIGYNRIVRTYMDKIRLTDDSTKFVLNHFSHNGLANYREFQDMVRPEGIIIAYDGLTLEA